MRGATFAPCGCGAAGNRTAALPRGPAMRPAPRAFPGAALACAPPAPSWRRFGCPEPRLRGRVVANGVTGRRPVQGAARRRIASPGACPCRSAGSVPVPSAGPVIRQGPAGRVPVVWVPEMWVLEVWVPGGGSGPIFGGRPRITADGCASTRPRPLAPPPLAAPRHAARHAPAACGSWRWRALPAPHPSAAAPLLSRTGGGAGLMAAVMYAQSLPSTTPRVGAGPVPARPRGGKLARGGCGRPRAVLSMSPFTASRTIARRTIELSLHPPADGCR